MLETRVLFRTGVSELQKPQFELLDKSLVNNTLICLLKFEKNRL
jgi:hypothetical protein